MITVEFVGEEGLVCVRYKAPSGVELLIVTEIAFVPVVLLDIKGGVFDNAKA